MEFALTTFRMLAASQVLLFIAILFCSRNPLRVRVIGIAIMSAIIMYFFAPLIVNHIGMEKTYFVYAIPSMVPTLTLLFVWVVFEEDSPIPKWVLGMFGVDLFLVIWRAFHGYSHIEAEVVAQLIKVIAALFSIYYVWRGREHDLVEMRLKVRLIFIGTLTITVLGVSIAQLFRIYSIELPGEILGVIWMFITVFFGNLAFIKMNPSLSLVGDPRELVVVEKPDDPEVDTLLERMRSERLYADHDLRVGSLADIIGVPEYQLRKNINQNLGYRNFNQFVNRYRIEEAGQRLLSDSKIPVLSIALDVGFRSISSFNTAFQAQFGVSPTKYRSQSLSNS